MTYQKTSTFGPWESYSYKVDIWFLVEISHKLAGVRPFLPLTNSNTNSVRAGQISFSENNFLHPSWEQSCNARYMRARIWASTIRQVAKLWCLQSLFSIRRLPVCQLIFNFGLNQYRAKTSYWNIQVFLGWLLLSGTDYFWWYDNQILFCSQDSLSLFPFSLVTIKSPFLKWFQFHN